MTSTEPWSLYTLTLPSPPTLTTTRFGMFTAGGKFRLEALGLETPLGKTVRKLPAEGATAVTLRTTAVTPAAGPRLVPITCTAPVAVCRGRPAGPPGRVGARRVGVGRTAVWRR